MISTSPLLEFVQKTGFILALVAFGISYLFFGTEHSTNWFDENSKIAAGNSAFVLGFVIIILSIILLIFLLRGNRINTRKEKLLVSQNINFVVHTWVAVVVSVLAGFFIGYYFFEGVTISSYEVITNNSVTVVLKNEHLIKSTSKIVVWGWDTVNGEFVLDSLTRGTFGPQQTQSRTYSIGKRFVNLTLENFQSNIPGVLGITDVPAGKVFIRNTLFYRITCVDCEGQDYWRPLREEEMIVGFECQYNKTERALECPSGNYVQVFWERP